MKPGRRRPVSARSHNRPPTAGESPPSEPDFGGRSESDIQCSPPPGVPPAVHNESGKVELEAR